MTMESGERLEAVRLERNSRCAIGKKGTIMAAADYRLCDICGNKAFYDAGLDYQSEADPELKVRGEHYSLQRLGDWKVICRECAKTHRCVSRKLRANACVCAASAAQTAPIS